MRAQQRGVQIGRPGHGDRRDRGGRFVFRGGRGRRAGPSPVAKRHDPAPERTVDHDLKGPFSERAGRPAQGSAPAGHLRRRQGHRARTAPRWSSSDKGKYVELAREKTDKIFTILVDFGDKVDDTTMFDPDGDGPKPPVKKYGGDARPRAQPDSRAGPCEGQQHGLAEGLQPEALPGPLLLARQEEGVAGQVLREAVLGPLLRRGRGLRLGQGRLERGPLRLQLLRRHQLRQRLGPDPRRRQPVGEGPEGGRPHRRADQDRSRQVRPVGPLRPRRRRQLQRARRLHRPLPDRARRRGRVRGRRRAGDQRHLGAPLVRLRHATPARPVPADNKAGRHADRRHRHLGRRLHHAAGERRPRRLRPRVRPRPGPAGRVRHHRHRRVLGGLLVADVLRLLAGHAARTPSATCPAT